MVVNLPRPPHVNKTFPFGHQKSKEDRRRSHFKLFHIPLGGSFFWESPAYRRVSIWHCMSCKFHWFNARF